MLGAEQKNMEQESKVPEVGETVVCKVKQVLNYGAFVELVEYNNSKGFVHVSQVASRWVKNIRNFVKEGQVRAAKVLFINEAKKQIDLSFTKVSSHAQRARIEEWKQLKRCKKLVEVLAKSEEKNIDQAWEEVAKPLLENNDTLFDAFQEIALLGEEATQGVKKEWVKPLLELVQKNIPVPEKTLKGTLTIKSEKPDGVDVIKEILFKAEAKDIEIFYKGGGKYSIKAKAPDYKSAEKVLGRAVEKISKELKKAGGEAKFERSETK